jgi:hypothetical protein
MKLTNFYQESKANQKYLVELLAFLPFIAMIITGLIMLYFHTNPNDGLELSGLQKNEWLFFHKLSSLITIPIIIWHLVQHIDWFKKLFTLRLKNKFKRLNTSLFVVFLFTMLTSLLSWLIFKDNPIGFGLRGFHSKLGFATIILFVFHIKNYFSWIIKMSRKLFKAA